MAELSSTSSSDARQRDLSGSPRTVVMAVVLLTLGLSCWELYLRYGDPPAVPRNHSADWQRRRFEMKQAESPRLVVLGSSRAQADFVPTLMGDQMGGNWRCFNLGIVVGNSFAMLKSSRHDFRAGDVVVLDVLPETCFAGVVNGPQRAAIPLANAAAPYEWLEDSVQYGLEGNLHLANTAVSPLDVAREGLLKLAGRDASDPGDGSIEGVIRHDNGWREAVSAGRPDPAQAAVTDRVMRQALSNRAAPGNARTEVLLADLQAMDTELAAQGVTLLFVQFPSASHYRHWEDRWFPREVYWDKLAAAFPGRCLYSHDDPVLSSLWVPDGSHLDREGAFVFSRHLAAWIKGRLADPGSIDP